MIRQSDFATDGQQLSSSSNTTYNEPIVLRLNSVRKSYGSTVAVDDLTLEIRPGEIFGLLGPNGAGKTTTVNLAVGVLTPDRGDVSIAGLGSPTQPGVRRSMGVASQSLALYDDLSAEENLSFFGSLYGLTHRVLRQRVAWSLDFVGLTDRSRQRVKIYSGGMKRRLNLAIALVHDPVLLLLDEPTVGVDPQSRNALFDNILSLRQDGKTIVYTTHYMEEAQRLCDRVGIMDHGRLLAMESVEQLIDAHGGEQTVTVTQATGVKTLTTDDPLKTLAHLQESGTLLSYSVDRPNLESVFLNLTGRQLRD